MMKNYIITSLLFCFTGLFSNLYGATYYRIGGGGDWADLSKWSLASGGAATTAFPVAGDSVIFDAASGIAPGDVISSTVARSIHSLFMNTMVSNFTFDFNGQSLSVSNQIQAFSGFQTNNMSEIIIGSTQPAIVASNSVIWDVKFRVNSTSTVTFVDNFSSTEDFELQSGNVAASNIQFLVANYLSSGALGKNVNFSGTIVNVTDVSFLLDNNYTAFTSMDSLSMDGNLTNVISGFGHVFNVVSTLAPNIAFSSSILIDSLYIAGQPNITIANDDTLSLNVLEHSPSCSANTVFSAAVTGGATSGYFEYIGVGNFYSEFLTFDQVNASDVPTTNYFINGLDTLNGSNGWNNLSNTYYWIGNGGNWSNPTHWSLTSGGSAVNCLPRDYDTLIFDANSFTSDYQTVIVDTTILVGAMTWANIDDSSALLLQRDLNVYGDVTLNQQMWIYRSAVNLKLGFNADANFDSDSAIVDCNVYLGGATVNTLNLLSPLIMTDSAAIFIESGVFNTNNHDIETNSVFIFTLSPKTVNLGSSHIDLASGWNSDLVTSNYTLNAGTSTIFIHPNAQSNFVITEGSVFHNVILDFGPNNFYPVDGSNTFNELTILPGSKVEFEQATTQTIIDSLIVDGTCIDTISIRSSTATNFTFSKTSGVVELFGADLEDVTVVGGATFTAYFSQNNGSTVNIIYSALPSTTADFSVVSGLCFGDTTIFVNNSTAYSGDYNDLTFQWDYDENNYSGDTLAYKFLTPGDHDVQLISTFTNGCTDTANVLVHINNADLLFTMSEPDPIICAGTVVTTTAQSSVTGALFEYFINGVSTGAPSITNTYTTSTLVTNDSISVVSYENGCISDTILSYKFTVNANPIVSLISNDADTSICAGTNVAFTSGGSSQYQFFKNGNPITGFLPGNTYNTSTLVNGDVITVIGKDATQCRDTSDMLLFEVLPLPATTLSESTGGNVICAGTSVTFTAAGADTYEFFVAGVSQGVPTASNTFTTSSLSGGQVVSVLGYSTGGCLKTAPQTFNYIVNPIPNTTLSSNDADSSICAGTNVTFNAGGGSTYEFFINGVSQGPASGTSFFSSASLVHDDTVQVMASFSGCSAISSEIIFEVLATPTTVLISSDANDSICQTENVIFTSNGATNYQFSINGVVQQAYSALNTFSSNAIMDNQTVTVLGEMNGCVVSDNITFRVLPLPNVNIFSSDVDNTICLGESITFTGTNSAQYQLFVDGSQLGVTQASPTFSPALTSGSHSVYIIGTAANGCSNPSTNTLSVQVNPIPTIVLNSSDADNIICSGSNVTFTGSGSQFYQFFINGVSQTSLSTNNVFSTNNLLSGQNVQIQGNSLGCAAVSNTINFTVNPIPVIDLTSTDVDNVFCQGTTVTYTSSGAAQYEFFVNGVSQGPASAVDNIDASTFAPGTYAVTVLGTANSCSASDALTITVNANPIVNMSSSDVDDIICSGNSVVFTGSGASTYQFFVNGTSQGAPSAVSTFNTAALVNNDMVQVTGFSGAGCSNNSSTITMTVNTTPIVGLNSSDVDNQICAGESITFTGTGANLYEFFINGVSQGVASASSTFVSSALANGNTVSVIGTTNGCTANSSGIATTVFNFPTVSLTNNANTALCSNEMIDVQANGANDFQFFINGSPVTTMGTQNTYIANVNDGDILTVSGSTNSCVASGINQIAYSVTQTPSLSVVSSDLDGILCSDDTLTLNTSGAQTYAFAIDGIPQQNGSSNVFSSSDISNGSFISTTGFNGACPSLTDTLFFVVNEMILTFDSQTSNIVCDGGSLIFDVNGGDAYEFFLNGTSQGASAPAVSYTATNLTFGDSISYTAFNNTTGCFQQLGYHIYPDVIATPSITPNSSTTFCEGDSLMLISNHVYGNQWTLNGSPIVGENDTIFYVYASGNYGLEHTAGGNGEVWSVGYNGNGTFGNGDNFNSITPEQANVLNNLTALSSGYGFALGLSSTGEVYAWGVNSSGQLGNGAFTAANTPVLLSLSQIVSIGSSSTSSAAIDQNGDLYVWGNNTFGQLGLGSTSVTNFPLLHPTLNTVEEITGGKNHFVALKTDGTVWTSGDNSFGQLGNNSLTGSLNFIPVAGLSNIIKVGTGENHSFAIDNNGDLYVWGNNTDGQLGLGDHVNRLTPVVSLLKNVTASEGGSTHSVFLTKNHEVYTAGGNLHGQLGNGTNLESLYPTKLEIDGVEAISAGEYSTLLLRIDHSVYGAGYNAENQISPLIGDVLDMTKIQGVNGVSIIESGRRTSHFIFGESESCVSADIAVTMNVVIPPTVTVSVNGLFSSTAASTYQWYKDGVLIPGANSQNYQAITTGDYTVAITDANGCSATSVPVYYGIAGIETNDLTWVRLYPNPSSGIFNIEFAQLPDNGKIEILDNSGRIILEETNLQSKMTVNLSGNAAGVYFIRLTSKGINFTPQRIVLTN